MLGAQQELRVRRPRDELRARYSLMLPVLYWTQLFPRLFGLDVIGLLHARHEPAGCRRYKM